MLVSLNFSCSKGRNLFYTARPPHHHHSSSSSSSSSPPPASPPSLLSWAPVPSPSDVPIIKERNTNSTTRVIIYALTALASVVVVVLVVIAIVFKCRNEKLQNEEIPVLREANGNERMRGTLPNTETEEKGKHLVAHVMSRC